MYSLTPDDSTTFEFEYGVDILKIPGYLPVFQKNG